MYTVLESYIRSTTITLKPLDIAYLKQIPKKDLDLMGISSDLKDKYNYSLFTLFTVYYSGEVCGVAGCRSYKNDKFDNSGFFLVYIDPKYRGMGLLCPVAKAVVKKLNLVSMFSTVYKRNVASIKSHSKSGCFRLIDEEREKELRAIGKLKNDEVRFEFIF